MLLRVFGEMVSSNDFAILLARYSHLFSPLLDLGGYMSALPIRNVVDFIWGTNAGSRALPITIWLWFLQKIFSTNWDIAYLVLTLALPGVLFLAAARMLGKIRLATVIAAVIYAVNPYILNRLAMGFWQLNIAYAFLPLVAVGIIKGKIVITAIAASIVTVGQPHLLVVISPLILFNLRNIRQLLLTGGLFLLINSYWLGPGILGKEYEFTTPGQQFSLAAKFENVLRFSTVGKQPTIEKWSGSEWCQITISLILFAALIANKKYRWQLILLWILSFWLAKGINEPGAGINQWIYQEIPAMQIFRDPSRFLMGMLVASCLAMSQIYINKKSGVVIILAILGANLLITKSLPGQILRTTIPDSYLQTQDYINRVLKSDGDYRVAVIPNPQSITEYPWYKATNLSSVRNVFEMMLPLKIPLANGSGYPDSWANQVSEYLIGNFQNSGNKDYLLPLGVKYIIFDRNLVSDTGNTILDSPDFKRLHDFEKISIYEVATPTAIVTNTIPKVIVGDLLDIKGKQPVILANQPANLINVDRLLNRFEVETSRNNPEMILAAEKMAPQYKVDIFSLAVRGNRIFGNFEPYKMEPIKTTGALFTSGQAVVSQDETGEIKVPKKIATGKYEVLIKYLSNNNGVIPIEIQENQFSLPSQTSLEWQDLGNIEIAESRDLTFIKNDGKYLVIDYLALIPVEVWQEEKLNIKKMLAQNNTSQPTTETQHFITAGQVYFSQPTTIAQLKYLYGKYWECTPTCDKWVSDGYGMAFTTDQQSFYEIRYQPENWGRYFMWSSGLIFAGSVGYLIINKVGQSLPAWGKSNNSRRR